MRMPAKLKTLALPLFVWLAFFAVDAHARPSTTPACSIACWIATRPQRAAGRGSSPTAATWLFWTLVVISMVWTFGMMALRKADIGQFFAEFVRFTIFTGFFWWALTNGPNFASSIYASLRQLAGNATGLGNALSPSGIVDVGFAIFDKVMDQSSVWSPVDSMAGILMAVADPGHPGPDRREHASAARVGLGARLRWRVLPRFRWFAAGLPTWRSTTTRSSWAWPRSSSAMVLLVGHRQDLPR